MCIGSIVVHLKGPVDACLLDEGNRNAFDPFGWVRVNWNGEFYMLLAGMKMVLCLKLSEGVVMVTYLNTVLK
ncbi:hypothetical protein MTR_8g011625 [Medicago truncatula]|uniref:Uncharacterized protein n=1 Tax=Medicago truncatula TaxID=3880 RepID=A0A072TKQ6_MEDTR|nr:hypothetical protein MTR_8g011625 [Medicago truncatula]